MFGRVALTGVEMMVVAALTVVSPPHGTGARVCPKSHLPLFSTLLANMASMEGGAVDWGTRTLIPSVFTGPGPYRQYTAYLR